MNSGKSRFFRSSPSVFARERESIRLWFLTALALSVSFYLHASMTGILVIPALFPFLILNKEGKVRRATLKRTMAFFAVFALMSAVGVYQFIDQSLRGLSLTPKPAALAEIPERLQFMLSFTNPAIFPLILITLILFFVFKQKASPDRRVFLFSFLFVFFIFLLMVFKLGSFVVILLAERAIWAVTLTLLVLLGACIARPKDKRGYFAGTAAFGLAGVMYIVLVIFLRPGFLLPSTLTKGYASAGSGTEYGIEAIVPKYGIPETEKYPPLTWNQGFENYRTDGLSYEIYHWWNLISSTQRYKGWFPAMKGLPLHWSGLVSGGQYGILGPDGTQDSSEYARNQALFFLDWYGISHLEERTSGGDIAEYLKEQVVSKEVSGDLAYYNLDPDIITPLYAPTNAKVVAVVAPVEQYDLFIRTLSYTGIRSSELIPIFIGKNASSLKPAELEHIDGIVMYGYSGAQWGHVEEFVKKGGVLFIDTGQKVAQTETARTPPVFPVEKTTRETITKPWAGELQGILTSEIDAGEFKPLDYNYLPFDISVGRDVREWGESILVRGSDVLVAAGEYGSGKVVWSGLNLPFHATDTRTMAEIDLLSNIFEWFFPDEVSPVGEFSAVHPSQEEITVTGSGARGVLIKEHHNPGWKASVNESDGEIYKSGLMEMYIPLAGNTKDFKVELAYKGNPVHWILFVISMATFVLGFVYVMLPKRITKHAPVSGSKADKHERNEPKDHYDY